MRNNSKRNPNPIHITAAYVALQGAVRPGDEFILARHAKSWQHGWGNHWTEPMSTIPVGTHLIVAENHNRVEHPEFGVPLILPAALIGAEKDLVQCFPWFALEWVKRGNEDYDKTESQLFQELVGLIGVTGQPGETMDTTEMIIRLKSKVAELKESPLVSVEITPAPTTEPDLAERKSIGEALAAPLDPNAGILIGHAGKRLPALPRPETGKVWRVIPSTEYDGRIHPNALWTFADGTGTEWRGSSTLSEYATKLIYVELVEQPLVIPAVAEEAAPLPVKEPLKAGDEVVAISGENTKPTYSLNTTMEKLIASRSPFKVARVDGADVVDLNGYHWHIDDLEFFDRDAQRKEYGSLADEEPSTPPNPDLINAVDGGEELLFIPNKDGVGGWDGFRKADGKRIVKGARNFSIQRPREIYDPRDTFGLTGKRSDIPSGCYYGVCGVPSFQFEKDSGANEWKFNGTALVARSEKGRRVDSVPILFLGEGATIRG